MRDGWVMRPLTEVAEILDRMRVPVNSTERDKRQGNIPYYGATGQVGWIDDYLFDEELVLLGEDAVDFFDPNAQKAYLVRGKSWVNNHAHVLRPMKSVVLPEFLSYNLNQHDYSGLASFGTRSKLTQKAMRRIQLAVPPHPVQRRIVDLVEHIDIVIQGAREVADRASDSYSELLRCAFSDGEVRTLGDVAEFINGHPFKPAELGRDGLPVIRIKQLLNPDEVPDRSTVDVPESRHLRDGDLIFTWSGTLAVRTWDRGPALLNQHLFRVLEREGVERRWLRFALDASIEALNDLTHGSTMKHITKKKLLAHPVSVPSMERQRAVGDLLESVLLASEGAQQVVRGMVEVRSQVLTSLLSGDHEIPESYDKFLEGRGAA